MNITKLLKVDPKKGAIKIEGLSEFIDFEKNSSWEARLLGHSSFLVEPVNVQIDQGSVLTKGAGSVTLLFDVLRGLHFRGWSGKIYVDLGDGGKSLYLKGGNIVFASSSYMEDRLGEVMYRHNDIKVEDYARISSLVSEEAMFGKLLIDHGLLSPFELWEALRTQVMEIIRSIFLYSQCSIVLTEGFFQTTEVVLEEPMPLFLDKLWAYYLKLNNFKQLLSDSSFVSIDPEGVKAGSIPHGAYFGDLVSVIGKKITVKDFIKKSNQSEGTSYHLLWLMRRLDLCKIEPFHLNMSQHDNQTQAVVKDAVGQYHKMVKIFRQACLNHNKVFPLESLKEQMAEIRDEGLPVFVLDEKGFIAPYSLHCMYTDSLSSKELTEEYCLHLAKLSSILRMVGIDTLGSEMMGRIVESIEKSN